MKNYAGIGPRATPPDVLFTMAQLSNKLSQMDYRLVSGHGAGADQAWECGVSPMLQTIWIPWKGFNGANLHPAFKVVNRTEPLLEIAARHHPNWNKLSDPIKSLMARNVAILLGNDLNTPVDFVLYWQAEGVNKYTGGTGHTLRMSDSFLIPNFNIGSKKEQELFEEYLSMEIRN